MPIAPPGARRTAPRRSRRSASAISSSSTRTKRPRWRGPPRLSGAGTELQSPVHALRQSTRHPRPPEFDTLAAQGKAIAGSPETVLNYLRAESARANVNYLVVQIAFGDLTPAEIARSVDLFARHVMPGIRDG